VYCCVSFYVALADVVLSTRIMIFSHCYVTLSFFCFNGVVFSSGLVLKILVARRQWGPPYIYNAII